MPLVATPPLRTAKLCSVLPSNGLSTRTARAAPQAPPIAMSPAQSSAKLACPRSPAASTSANRPFARPPLSMPHAGGTSHDARPQVDLQPTPAGVGARLCRPAHGCERERGRQRQGLAEVALVACVHDLPHQRRVDEAAGQPCGQARGDDEAREQRAHGHLATRIVVQSRQLAVGQKPREAHVPALQRASRPQRGLLRRASPIRAGHVQRARRPEAVEALDVLARAHHDCEVVTVLAASLDSLELDFAEPDPLDVDSLALDSPELDSPSSIRPSSIRLRSIRPSRIRRNWIRRTSRRSHQRLSRPRPTNCSSPRWSCVRPM